MRSDLSFAWRLAVFSICAVTADSAVAQSTGAQHAARHPPRSRRAFKVVDGKIRQVEATVFSVPYKMNPGWPDE
jgi:hypothetical protein